MVKNITVLGAFKVISLLFISLGMSLFASFYVEPWVCILISYCLTIMIAEDWIDQTIDVRYLAAMTLLLLFGIPDQLSFCLKYVFLLLLFRVFFLWMMRFEPVSVTQDKESFFQLPMGFLPVFGLSFCLVFLFPFTGDNALSCFSNIEQGYTHFVEQISGSPEILAGIFAIMVFLILLGEARRRSQPANVEEVWPFGDGDGWFLAAWGATIDLGIFFLIFIVCQLILLIMYAGKFILGSETLHE